MKTFGKRILPKTWLSVFAIGLLFLGLTGATVQASDDQNNGYFSLTNITELMFGATANSSSLLVGDTLQFSSAVYTVDESGDGTTTPPAQGKVTITVVRTGNVNDPNPTQVTYFTSPGTAQNNGPNTCNNPGNGQRDYIDVAGTLTFTQGVTQQTFDIPICDDNVFENNPNPEQFNISLVIPTNGAVIGSPSAAIVQITDNDAPSPGRLRFQPTNYTPNEFDGTVDLNVVRNQGQDGAVSATYTFADGTATGGASCATAGVDYINTPGTVDFADGQTTATITVTICDDANFEGTAMIPNEFFTVTLSNPTGGAVIANNDTATVTIIEDDANTPGTLNFSGSNPNSRTPQVTEAATTLTLTVVRSVGTTGAISADYTLGDGTAMGGTTCGNPNAANPVDYINPAGMIDGTVNFGPGQTTSTITVQICNDNIDEMNETFTVTLGPGFTSNGGTVNFGAFNQSTITILDNENGTFQFDPASYTVGESDGFVSLTVTRTGGTQGAVTVQYTLNDGTPAANAATGGPMCTAGVDYINPAGAPDGTLSFAAGISSQSFVVQICPDSIFETGSPNTAVGARVPETFTATLSNPSAANPMQTPLLGNQGRANTNLTATPITATVNITDDEVQNGGTVQFGAGATQSVNEPANGTGSFILNVPVTRTGGTDGNVSFDITTTSGTATGGTVAQCNAGTVDYVIGDGNFTAIFPNGNGAGGQGGFIQIRICDDSIFEGNETFTITLTNPMGGVTIGANNSATITILDNDANAGTVTVPATASVSEAAGSITITVTRDNSQGAVTVPYSLANGTAMGGLNCTNQNNVNAVDFINGGGTVTFANGVSTATITVPICNDNFDESNETFSVILGPQSGVTGGATIGGANTTVVTILDDENGTIQFSASTVSFDEGVGSATITVTRTNSQGTVAVDYTLANGTATGGASCATNGVDYINPAGSPDGTLVFGNGVTTQTFTVQICNDAFDEPNETFTATLSNPQNGALLGTPTTITVTITDNDATPGLSIGDFSDTEGNAGTKNFTFTVTLDAVSNQTVTVAYATADGTATGGTCGTGNADYQTTSGTATIAAGQTTTTVTVPVCGDLMSENNETFFVNLTTPTNSMINDNQGLGGIVNDDGTQGTIAVGNVVRINEGDGGQTNATITLTLTGNTTPQASTVQYTLGGGTATGGAACGGTVDYVNTGGTATFAANTTTTTITVPICGDTRKEANETFLVTLSNANNASISNGSGTVIIIDDDQAVRADYDRDGVTDYSVFRPSNGFTYILLSQSGLFRAVPSNSVSGDIAVPGDYDNDGATDVAYYRPSTGTFTVIQSTTNLTVNTQLGTTGDIPVQGDYDGDGDTDAAVFRPSTGTFFTSSDPATNFGAITFGANGDRPVQADYDGDGRTDVAVYRPSEALCGGSSAFFVRNSSTGTSTGACFGISSDTPVTGDFDGDGRADFTVFRPSGNFSSGGVFYTFSSLTQTTVAFQFGLPGDIPAAGDYDGDGTLDYATFRGSAASPNPTFTVRLSSTGGFTSARFGTTGDIPLAGAYQPLMTTP